MNLEEAFNAIECCVLTHNDCIFLIRKALEGLECLQEKEYFALVEDMNVGEEPICPGCGFPMHVSTDICISCKEKEEE